MSGEKSLYKYTNLHRMANDLNIEVEASAEIALNEDRQVIAAVGGAVMALGMGLAELATEEKMSDEQVSELLLAVETLAAPAATSWVAMTNVGKTIDGASIANDLSEEEATHVFIKGLEEVSGYVRQRVKPDPL
jgi:hypothetical protein